MHYFLPESTIYEQLIIYHPQRYTFNDYQVQEINRTDIGQKRGYRGALRSAVGINRLAIKTDYRAQVL